MKIRILALIFFLSSGYGHQAQSLSGPGDADAPAKLSHSSAIETQLSRARRLARSRLKKLPQSLQEMGEALFEQTDEIERVNIIEAIIERDASAAREFLLDVLSDDPSSSVRLAIVDYVGRQDHPRVRQMLERLATSDPNAEIAVMALERLRGLRVQDIRKILDRRLESARGRNDEASLRVFLEADERWISLVRGTMLPAFLREVPPKFSAKADEDSVRVLAFGDFGTGDEAQKRLAAVMLEHHRKSRFDFGVTLGDNFYPHGMKSPAEPRWEGWWNDLYGPLGIMFYASLGNHDWDDFDSPAAQILHTGRSESWYLPSPYYTFTAGPLQFFALDTNEISEAQYIWLDKELSESRARWKIVYGHHPIYSDGWQGDTRILIQRLLPMLKGRADIYLAGHDHDLQHLKPEDGLHFFISGGGGATNRRLRPGSRSLFARSEHGFTILEASANRLKVTFIGIDGNQLYEYLLSK